MPDLFGDLADQLVGPKTEPPKAEAKAEVEATTRAETTTKAKRPRVEEAEEDLLRNCYDDCMNTYWAKVNECKQENIQKQKDRWEKCEKARLDQQAKLDKEWNDLNPECRMKVVPCGLKCESMSCPTFTAITEPTIPFGYPPDYVNPVLYPDSCPGNPLLPHVPIVPAPCPSAPNGCGKCGNPLDSAGVCTTGGCPWDGVMPDSQPSSKTGMFEAPPRLRRY